MVSGRVHVASGGAHVTGSGAHVACSGAHIASNGSHVAGSRAHVTGNGAHMAGSRNPPQGRLPINVVSSLPPGDPLSLSTSPQSKGDVEVDIEYMISEWK